MSDIECPYCNAELDINHDDGFGYYEEDVKHRMECKFCGKTFVFETCISFNYYPEKADCLNGEEHKFERTFRHPYEFTVMRCTDCDEERDLTEKEWEEFSEYLKDKGTIWKKETKKSESA